MTLSSYFKNSCQTFVSLLELSHLEDSTFKRHDWIRGDIHSEHFDVYFKSHLGTFLRTHF